MGRSVGGLWMVLGITLRKYFFLQHLVLFGINVSLQVFFLKKASQLLGSLTYTKFKSVFVR